MHGRNRKPGKLRDTALLNSMVNKNKSWAMRRLMKDLKEIEEDSVPTVGVTARPTDKDLFTWRGNLRGPDGTPYQGGVFHIEIKFTELYPSEPPTIRLMTPLTHPNVFGTSICLDMLNGSDRVLYQGWTSGYTVQSILIQLQSFLFEKPKKDSEEKIKEEVKAANEFKDLAIGHKGPLNPYPPFSTKEKDLDNFSLDMGDMDLLEEECVCFHTRLRLSKKETTLGAGITISRLPRTGEIRSVSTTLDLLSIQAYMKCGVRTSLSNEKFTHFLPLYFGIEKEKTIFLAEHALGLICKGSTRKFEPNQVLEVLPKMLLTLVVDMTNEALHHSYKSIRMLMYVHRLLTLFLEKYPQLNDTIDEKLQKFIDSPEKRIKDETPNIGELLVLLTVSQKYNWDDLKSAYLGEQLDRQVFWVLQELPDLEKADHPDLEDAKVEASFKATIVGYRITMLLKQFNTEIIEHHGKDFAKLNEYLDNRYGQLTTAEEDKFKRKIEEIFNVRGFLKYYQIVGQEIPDKKALAESLKQAVKNSAEKKYHGDEKELNAVPDLDVQGRDLLHSRPTLLKYWDEKKQKLDKEGDDDFWKKLCCERFSWISEKVHHSADKWIPKDFAERNDYVRINGTSKKDDPLLKHNDATFKDNTFKKIESHKAFHDYSEGMTWLELFAKLDFEEFLDSFPLLNNFKYLYDYMHAVKGKIRCLFLRIQYKRLLKSGYYFYMVLLTNMTSIESLIISDVENRLGSAYKYLLKGFTNFHNNGGKLKKLFLHQCYTSYLSGGIYKILKNLPDLESLETKGSNLNDEAGKAFGKILSDNKSVKELNLSDTYYYDNIAKDIADGLMRAKLLEVLKLRNNNSLYNGISPMLYNLAFSPRIKFIDLTGCNIGGNTNICEALYKLVKISGSLENLILNNTGCASSLGQEFFVALGENKTLKSLHIDTTTLYPAAFCQNLGKGIAMNAKKNGSIDTISCKNGFDTNNLNSFVNALYISEQCHEMWYGDIATANKMAGEDLEKKIYCNLKHFDVEGSSLPYYGNLNQIKKKLKPQWPELVKLFSTEVTHIDMAKCKMNQKRDMELVACCIENPIWKTKCSFLNLSGNKINKEGAKIFCEVLKKQFTITHLDLSGNKLGVAGCQAVAKALLNNTSLKFLNLYSNQMDVDGARCFKETLLVNDTLEYIDVGSNRLRNNGILAMAEGIAGNKSCALKGIGIRYNFVSDDGADKFFEILIKSSKVKRVFAKNNYFTEPYLTGLEEIIKKSGKNIYVDCLDKLKFLDQVKLDKSIWISPINASFTPNNITTFFQDTHKCGLVKEVRIYKGNDIPGKPQSNYYAIVEFEHENSVPRSLRVASKQQSMLNGCRFRIYKAGTANMVSTAPKASKNPVTRHVGRGGRGRGGRGGRGGRRR